LLDGVWRERSLEVLAREFARAHHPEHGAPAYRVRRMTRGASASPAPTPLGTMAFGASAVHIAMMEKRRPEVTEPHWT
jgi:hypothetical protein